MYSHAPQNYTCPICLGINREKSSDTLIVPTDIVFQNDLITILIGSFGIGKFPGHILIVPNQHIENIFDMTPEMLNVISMVSKQVAIALKSVLECEGITLLQNNEPAGGQHAFHYHQHVFPRFDGDELHEHMNNKQLVEPEERQALADKIKTYFQDSPILL